MLIRWLDFNWAITLKRELRGTFWQTKLNNLSSSGKAVDSEPQMKSNGDDDINDNIVIRTEN